MELSSTTEQQICELIYYRIDHDRGSRDLLLSSARVFGLARNILNAPTATAVKNFLSSYRSKIAIGLLDYLLDVYEGKTMTPELASPNTDVFKSKIDHVFVTLHYFIIGQDVDEQMAHIGGMVKNFIRIECQIKCNHILNYDSLE